MTPQHYGLGFHHFGLATRHADRSKSFLLGMGYSVGEAVYDPLQEVMLNWCSHTSMPAVEVVSPSGKSGPLDNLLSKYDDLTYHLCYRSADIEASVAAIAAGGHRVITVAAMKPAVLFDGRQVGFYMVNGFGLIEIVQDR